MGGGNAGEFASRLIMSWVKRHAKDLYETFSQKTDDPAPLKDLLISAHQGINQLATEANNLKGMGATVTLAWLTPGMLHLAHIGDSRLYLCRDGATTQLSEDHVRVWRQLQRGEIKEYQYRTHPRRSALYDVLGGGHRGIHPQLLSYPIQSGDRLLLCSDGIIDGLWERNIAEELAAEGDPRAIADQILAQAAQNDGRDDCTLIVADIHGL
jgi:serine/threonine protein phosphatase PrpC